MWEHPPTPPGTWTRLTARALVSWSSGFRMTGRWCRKWSWCRHDNCRKYLRCRSFICRTSWAPRRTDNILLRHLANTTSSMFLTPMFSEPFSTRSSSSKISSVLLIDLVRWTRRLRRRAPPANLHELRWTTLPGALIQGHLRLPRVAARAEPSCSRINHLWILTFEY